MQYREGLYVGYRYYQTARVPVAFPFGYGLSYTSFAYSDLKVTADSVTLTVTNTGARDGAEIVQVYIAKPGAEIFRPAQELKAFAGCRLRQGEPHGYAPRSMTRRSATGTPKLTAGRSRAAGMRFVSVPPARTSA